MAGATRCDRDFQMGKEKWAPRLKFVLFFGDGHFDYRNVGRTSAPNWIPPFQKDDAATDDYYTYLDPGEKALWWRTPAEGGGVQLFLTFS